MSPSTSECGCEGEECICHFYHYDCACGYCPECAEDCFCFNPEDAMEHQVDPTAITEEMLGERPELDPFLDDTPIDCDLENPEVCESCQ